MTIQRGRKLVSNSVIAPHSTSGTYPLPSESSMEGTANHEALRQRREQNREQSE